MRLPLTLLPCSGVAEMATELFDVLRPHMEAARHVELAGHSLGGSLATLLALTAHLRIGGGGGSGDSASSSSVSSSSDGRGSVGRPEGGFASSSSGSSGASRPLQRGRLSVHCTTFGSPPVLALANQPDEDGQSILRASWVDGSCKQADPVACKTRVPQLLPVPWLDVLSAHPCHAVQALQLPAGTFRNYVLQASGACMAAVRPGLLVSAHPAASCLALFAAGAGPSPKVPHPAPHVCRTTLCRVRCSAPTPPSWR